MTFHDYGLRTSLAREIGISSNVTSQGNRNLQAQINFPCSGSNVMRLAGDEEDPSQVFIQLVNWLLCTLLRVVKKELSLIK